MPFKYQSAPFEVCHDPRLFSCQMKSQSKRPQLNTDAHWEKKKNTALPFMHIYNSGSMQGVETSATADSADRTEF